MTYLANGILGKLSLDRIFNLELTLVCHLLFPTECNPSEHLGSWHFLLKQLQESFVVQRGFRRQTIYNEDI